MAKPTQEGMSLEVTITDPPMPDMVERAFIAPATWLVVALPGRGFVVAPLKVRVKDPVADVLTRTTCTSESVVGVVVPALIAGLSAFGAIVGVGPPLFWSGPNFGSAIVKGVPVTVPPLMLTTGTVRMFGPVALIVAGIDHDL